jgi:hypothetical protein
MAAREATGAEVCIEVFTCAFTSFTYASERAAARRIPQQ